MRLATYIMSFETMPSQTRSPCFWGLLASPFCVAVLHAGGSRHFRAEPPKEMNGSQHQLRLVIFWSSDLQVFFPQRLFGWRLSVEIHFLHITLSPAITCLRHSQWDEELMRLGDVEAGVMYHFSSCRFV